MVMNLSKGENMFCLTLADSPFHGHIAETHLVVEVESEKTNRRNFVVGAVNTN